AAAILGNDAALDGFREPRTVDIEQDEGLQGDEFGGEIGKTVPLEDGLADVPKTTIPPTFACSNLVGLTNGKALFTNLRPNITEALEMTSCVATPSVLSHHLPNGVETVEARTAGPGICSDGVSGGSGMSSRKTSVADAALIAATKSTTVTTDTSDTAAILQAIISRRSSVAEPSTSPPTFQPLPGQTSITDSPEMQAIYDSLSRKSSIPTLSDTNFFPSLDITDSGFADTSDSMGLFSQLPLTAVPGTEAPISLPDFSTMSAISNMPDSSDCSSFLHMSMNSSGISEASDSIAFSHPVPLPGVEQTVKETLVVTATTVTTTCTTVGKLPALPPIGPTTTMAVLAEGKPIVEATGQTLPAVTSSIIVTGAASTIVTANGSATTVATTVSEVAKSVKPTPAPVVTTSTPFVKPTPAPVPTSVVAPQPQPASQPSKVPLVGSLLPTKQPSAPVAPPAQPEQKGGFFQSTTVNIGSFFNKVNKNLVHQESTDSLIGAKSKSFFASMKSSFSLDSSKASVDEGDVQQVANAPQPPAAHLDVVQQPPTDLSPLTAKGGMTPSAEGSLHEQLTPSSLHGEQQPSPPRDNTSFEGQLEPSPVGTQPSPLAEYEPDDPYQTYEPDATSGAELLSQAGDVQLALEKDLDPNATGGAPPAQRRQSLFRAQGSEDGEGGSKWKLLKTLKEKRIEEKQKVVEVGESFDDEPGLFKKVDVSGKNEEPEVNDTAAAPAFGGRMRLHIL
uniref:Uncharacterized protein n=1 Tax=Anopheles maculatus TaxID=74869 RepID=A0A182SQ78_9DIPT